MSRRYPDWFPEVVRSVEVSERHPDGSPAQARTVLHVSQGPLNRDIELVLSVEVGPSRVLLQRIPYEPSDPEDFAVTWQLHDDAGATRVELALEACLSVPRLVPVGGIGDSMARGFVAAAVKELEG